MCAVSEPVSLAGTCGLTAACGRGLRRGISLSCPARQGRAPVSRYKYSAAGTPPDRIAPVPSAIHGLPAAAQRRFLS